MWLYVNSYRVCVCVCVCVCVSVCVLVWDFSILKCSKVHELEQ
jgi:hypothetical protein